MSIAPLSFQEVPTSFTLSSESTALTLNDKVETSTKRIFQHDLEDFYLKGKELDSFSKSISNFIIQLESLSPKEQITALLDLYKEAAGDDEKISKLNQQLRPFFNQLIETLLSEVKKSDENAFIKRAMAFLCYVTQKYDSYKISETDLDLLVNLVKTKKGYQRFALISLLNLTCGHDKIQSRLSRDFLPYLVEQYAKKDIDRVASLKLMINLTRENSEGIQLILNHRIFDDFFLAGASSKELYCQAELLENTLYSSNNQSIPIWVTDTLIYKLAKVCKKPVYGCTQLFFHWTTYQYLTKRILSFLCILSPEFKEKILKEISLDELKRHLLTSRRGSAIHNIPSTILK